MVAITTLCDSSLQRCDSRRCTAVCKQYGSDLPISVYLARAPTTPKLTRACTIDSKAKQQDITCTKRVQLQVLTQIMKEIKKGEHRV